MHPYTSYAELPPLRVAYGIDFGGAGPEIVRATGTGASTKWERLTTATPQVDADVALMNVLQRVRAETESGHALLAAALPVLDSSVRWVTAPFSSSKKAQKVFPSLLDIQLPFPLESCVYGFPFMEQTDAGQTTALAVAARTEAVTGRMQWCATQKADPQVLDHEGLALWDQGLRESPPQDPDERRMVAYLGIDRTVWTTGTGARLASAHASRIGTVRLTDPEADTRAMQEWGDRVVRLARATAGAGSSSPVIRWCWVGPGAAQESLRRSLETRLAAEMDVQFITLPDPVSFLARALALRALTRPPLFWNFLFGAHTHPRVEALRGDALKRTGLTLLVAGLLCGVFNAGFTLLLDNRHQTADRLLNETAQTLTGLPSVPRGQERIVVERAVQEQAAALAPFHRARESASVQRIHALLRAARENNLRYESITFRPDALQIQGTADDWDQGETLVAMLRDEGWTVQFERQDAIAEEQVRFRISAGRTP